MDLTIIIPAYNEEKRLPPTLERVLRHLTVHYQGMYEIIVVDDGSADGTSKSVEAFINKYENVRLVCLGQNKGRGVAVREGVSLAQGNLVLEMDADGSVGEEAITRFVAYMNTHADIDMLIGSRNIAGAKILVPQPFMRRLLGYVFFIMAMFLFGWWDFRDRVNGFKMFRKAAANDIFSHQHETGFLAEAEVVIIATRRNWKYELLPVLWTDYRDSRIRPMRDSWRSFWGMFEILKRDWRGIYGRKTS
ncbi:MAG: glycosyltransferase [Candidatus Sungbacteria bacterium]|nr:glycosyltransferase [bacterium]MDZ4260454.1 glycosyltransferase [Candidatus Sungbacteria bacterium]